MKGKKLMKTAVVVLAATAVCTVFATMDEARVRDYLKGTPSETRDPNGPDGILVNKPDYVVFVPKHEKGKNDPAKPSDTYNDHFQVIENPSNRYLYAFWTQASREDAIDQHIAFSRSCDRGITWSEPTILAGSHCQRIPSLIASWQQPMLTKSGRLYCLWNQKVRNVRIRTDLMGSYSDDDGTTWSVPDCVPFVARLQADMETDGAPSNWINWQRPLRLGRDGKFFVGSSRKGARKGEGRYGGVEFWQFENIDTNPEIARIKINCFCTNRMALCVEMLGKGNWFTPKDGRTSLEEAGIVKLPDGRLFALMRSTVGHPVWSQSRDGGRTWDAPKVLLDHDGGKPFLHPRSPCPIYDWKGPEAGSGIYFALIHQKFDFNADTAYQKRGPLYLIAGTFDPTAEQPISFKPPKLFAPRERGNAFYTSYCILDGKGVLWYNDMKYFLCGRIIGREWFE